MIIIRDICQWIIYSNILYRKTWEVVKSSLLTLENCLDKIFQGSAGEYIVQPS